MQKQRGPENKKTTYFRARKKNNKKQYREVKGVLLFLTAFILSYCLVVPGQSGAIGNAIASVFFISAGKASFLFPVLLVWWGIVYFKKSYKLHMRLDALWAVFLLVSASSFFSLLSVVFSFSNMGGWLGLKLNPFFTRLFGGHLSLVINLIISSYLVSIILRVSIKELAIKLWHRIIEDYYEWQRARVEQKKQVAKFSTLDKKEYVQKELFIPQINSEPRIVNTNKAVKKTEFDEKIKGNAHQAVKSYEIQNEYILPTIDFLFADKGGRNDLKKEEHFSNAELLTKTLSHFNITATVKDIIPGPIVTRYDIELAPGIKIQSVVALTENIALAMRSPSIRIVSIPEKAAVGVEVPNSKGMLVGLKGILATDEYQNSRSLITLALGKTTDGVPYVTDLIPMPHLLIAGATGSGKSVCIHSIILSILYKAKPDEVKFLLIDPKRLEMPTYRGLPHIYDPRVMPENADIVTQPKEAAESLKKLVKVMEKRYEKFAREAVRNIEGYNEKMAQTGGQKEYYIVVIIDELADLMMVASKEVEDSIQRLAQMARAVGIHLILATQRPSVDVITGVIKANFSARIAFQTASKVDSRVILDSVGADDLLGKGDMLFIPPGESKPVRLQGAFVSIKEAEKVVAFIRQQNIKPQYEYLSAKRDSSESGSEEKEYKNDLNKALRLVTERKRVSQDLLKAHFGSSAKATNILSLLETKGFINKPEGTNRWTIDFEKVNGFLNESEAVNNLTVTIKEL